MEILLALLVGGLVVLGYWLHRRVEGVERSYDSLFDGGRIIRIDHDISSEDGSRYCAECGFDDEEVQ